MTLFNDFGVIEELQLQDKGYYKLVVTNPAPFHTKTLRFNVWNTDHLQNTETGEEFDIGDQVEVSYHINESNFLRLDKLSPTNFEHCPICHSAVAPIDVQRMDCSACCDIPSSTRKEWINTPMRLISCVKGPYKYSVGYRIELLSRDCKRPYVYVIFPNTFLYTCLLNLKVGNVYTVLAWRKDRLLDVLEIY